MAAARGRRDGSVRRLAARPDAAAPSSCDAEACTAAGGGAAQLSAAQLSAPPARRRRRSDEHGAGVERALRRDGVRARQHDLHGQGRGLLQAAALLDRVSLLRRLLLWLQPLPARAGTRSAVEVHPWQCPSLAPAPPQGSGFGAPRKRPAHWAPSHCLGCSRLHSR